MQFITAKPPDSDAAVLRGGPADTAGNPVFPTMTEHEPKFDLEIRVPGVAFDIAQKGFPRVLVIQRLAESIREYDEGRPDEYDGLASYTKNAASRPDPSDEVYQCVYLTENPLGNTDWNDPTTRYPLPESRLLPFRAERADPIDDTMSWTPREAVAVDVLWRLFATSDDDESAPSVPDIYDMALSAGFTSDIVGAARDRAEFESLELSDQVTLDDSDGPEFTEE